MEGGPSRRNTAGFLNFWIRHSVNEASAVSTTRALNLDFPSSRAAKAELATRKISETSRKLGVPMMKRMMSRFSEFII